MSQHSTIGIVGSGIVGALSAYLLTQAGHEVVVFEKGPEYAYPHSTQWQERHTYLYNNPAYTLPDDLKNYTSEGIPFDLERERFMRTGGSASAWEGICIRMMPEDFQTRTLFGYGNDWAIGYQDLEADYGRAEVLLGVSGTDDDNPFAPNRSTPYPLPQFDLTHDDQIMQARLAQAGITLHTTPQARTRQSYEDRPGCANFGTCQHCPIGARYSPNYHLQKAIDTGLCTVLHNASVRRVHPDADNNGATILYRLEDADTDESLECDIVIIGAGAIESARLLLLSQDERYPDGLGNARGLVGQGLTFHHVWKGRLRYDESLYPFRLGGWSGQSLQFINAPTRGDHASLKVEFSSRQAYEAPATWETANNLQEALLPQLQWRQIVLQAEVPPSPEKHLVLSGETDRYGDPYAHVRYEFTDFDRATYDFARHVFDQFVQATQAVQSEFPPMDWWDSGSHHMGTCRISDSPENGVVNRVGQLHHYERVFVLGGSNFVGTSGAVNPTLTIAALTLRSIGFILEQML